MLITCRADEAARKAAVLKSSFDAAPEAVDLPPGIGLSVGAIEVPSGATDLMSIINRADELMDRDKGWDIGDRAIAALPKPPSPWRRLSK